MIITKLMGGLGNQLFQYSMGRRVSHINNTNLKLDISWFKDVGGTDTAPRNYALHAFNIVENFASSNEIAKFKNKIRNLLEKFKPYYRRSFMGEPPNPRFDPNMLKVSDNAYLEGYWQNEKYFKDIEKIIRKEFTVKTPQTGKNKEVAKQIDECNSISLHVRRGDYISSPTANRILGVCQPKYYSQATKYIAKKIRKPVFFVFSDEIGWVKKNLKLSYPTIYIDYNGLDKDYEDLRLMTICKHNIIANSTLSWWGAWLNNNKNKIVITPQDWFKDISINTEDLVPKSWIKI